MFMKIDIIKKLALCACVAAGLGLASCEDFLTITPKDKIVEEDFWEDKNDLENVVAACYKRLVDNDILTKYIQWGEVRSDNFEKAVGVNDQNLLNLMNANLLPTNGMFSWTAFYNAINYCNKVLAHGPEILERDESFSQGDWEPLKAEVITLRAYSHFWLLRTFGEVPYVTEDYNNDEQELKLPQSTQLQVLDSIVNDLESIKDIAMQDYNDNVWNKGRITRKAVYTLLADVYLWTTAYRLNATPQGPKTTRLPTSKIFARSLTPKFRPRPTRFSISKPRHPLGIPSPYDTPTISPRR